MNIVNINWMRLKVIGPSGVIFKGLDIHCHFYHICCINIFVFACPIIAGSQCPLFVTRANIDIRPLKPIWSPPKFNFRWTVQKVNKDGIRQCQISTSFQWRLRINLLMKWKAITPKRKQKRIWKYYWSGYRGKMSWWWLRTYRQRRSISI